MAIKKMNLKPKKKKKFRKIKLLFYLMIIYIGFACTFYYSLKKHKTISNEEFINLLVTTGNPNILNKYKLTSIVNGTMKLIFKIDFTKPDTILDTSILKYGKLNKEKTISLEYNDDYSNMDDLKKVSDYIDDPNPKEIKDPIVYLYNTHQTENYKKIDGTSFEPNIMIATDYLKEKISNSGINTIVEKRNISDVLLKNNWSYGSSYRVSRSFIESTINEYQSIKYLFDIHRDSGSHEYTTLCINNKCYAKILFLIGLENANYIENQEYAENLSKRLNNKVNGISKGILQKQGPKVNGVYNEDFSNRTILIEVGGENNTIDEVYNTIDVLSEVIIDYIKEEYYGI